MNRWVGRDKKFKCAWLMIITSHPSLEGYHSVIHVTKEGTGDEQNFPVHTDMGPKVSSRLVKSLQTLFASDLLLLLVSFCCLQ